MTAESQDLWTVPPAVKSLAPTIRIDAVEGKDALGFAPKRGTGGGKAVRFHAWHFRRRIGSHVYTPL